MEYSKFMMHQHLMAMAMKVRIPRRIMRKRIKSASPLAVWRADGLPTHPNIPHFLIPILFINRRRRGAFNFKRSLVRYRKRIAILKNFNPRSWPTNAFFLTAEPTKKKKKERWSNWRKQMVEVPDEHETNDFDSNDKNMDNPDPFSASMQVMQVELFSNSTFVTTGGLGQAVTLRGKWMIIGQDKDQLWMQVWRFGFGRSVSGSTYSEGAQLTQNDDKGYWGTIYEQENTGRFEVRGMVMLGYGLEPTTIGRFTMIEQQDGVVVDDDEEQEEEEGKSNEHDDGDNYWGAFE
uniref:Uncharacterized protein n=1 Tax=Leptocylindrus danicus TaxID=163516 RepID=A0A7S2K7R0_9STRA|mmetsp:Transcript_19382/g.28884  ORF Transcript_19382/g.28884 Transcript_19382/m.28884 type:complete len:291 (+) Transcript_19382:679-1551(+)